MINSPVTKPFADMLARRLTDEDSDDPKPWTYKAEPSGNYSTRPGEGNLYNVIAYDEDGNRLGAI